MSLRTMFGVISGSSFHFQTTSTGSVTMTLSLNAGSTLEIDWGDGTTTTATAGANNHTYSGGATKNILFIGDLARITSITFNSASLTDLNIANLTNLNTITSTGNSYTEITLDSSSLTQITFSSNTSLTTVETLNLSTACIQATFTGCTSLTTFGPAGTTTGTCDLRSLKSNANTYSFNQCAFTKLIGTTSTNTAVTTLYFDNNNMTYTTGTPMDLTWVGGTSCQIYFQNNTNLAAVDITGVTMTQFIMQGCTGLTMVDIGGGVTTEADFAGNTTVTSINMGSTSCTTCDISGCTSLTTFKINSNTTLTTINIGSITTLLYFWAYGCTALTKVDTGATAADTADLGTNTSLLQFWLDSCSSIKYVEVPNLTLGCNVNFTNTGLLHNSANPLDLSGITGSCSVFLGGCTLLEEIYLGSCSSIVTFSINPSTGSAFALDTVDTGATPTGTLDFSNLTSLATLYIHNTAADTIDISGCTSLNLYQGASNSSLTLMEVGTISSPTTFNCSSSSSLAKINTSGTGAGVADVSNFTSVVTMNLSACAFTNGFTLGLSTASGTVSFGDNSLSSANVDAIVSHYYTNRASYTSPNTLSIGGTNANPGGIYQDNCPPATGLEEVYVLVNDNCSEGINTWTVLY